MHVVPTHSEEDGEGGKEELKEHSSRTADFSCVLGSQSLKINHETPPPYQQALWKGCTKKALTVRATIKFKCLEFAKRHLNYDWNRVLWSDETKIVKINGIMNSTNYQDILAKNPVTSAWKLKFGCRWTFKQDNDLKHTSKSTQ